MVFDPWFLLYLAAALFALALVNLPILAGAIPLARRLNRGGRSEFLLLTAALWMFGAVFAFAAAGVTGFLHLPGVLAGSLLYGAGCFLAGRSGGKRPLPGWNCGRTAGERFLLLTLILLMTVRQWQSSAVLGTDTFLYHFYYPAMWLESGRIAPVPLPGQPHEYFPVCGELLYGFLMLPGRDPLFAVALQNLFCIIMVLAVLALSEAWRLSRRAALGGALLLQCCPMICYWAQLGYTDVLNGAVLATGVILLLLAMHRRTAGYALIAGIMLGASCAIKYSGLLVTPTVTVLLLGYFAVMHRKWRQAVILAAGAAGTGLLFYLPNWLRTGNPFYPVRIPGLFPAGIDFPREAVGFHRLSEFFIGDASGMLNWPQVLLILAAVALSLLMVFLPASRRRKALTREMAVLAAAVLAAGAVQLALYPAMTQARSILPVMMTAGILFPALFDRIDFLWQKRLPVRLGLIAAELLLVLALLDKPVVRHILHEIALVLALALALAPISGRWFRRAAWLVLGAGSMFLLFMGGTLNVNSEHFWPEDGRAVYDIVKQHCLEHGKPVRIANAGSWLNYMLMFAMPGNVVQSVPVNAENTDHAHELSDISRLRGSPVSYAVWLERLRAGGYAFLLVDTAARSDYRSNAALERDWADAHPEDFIKLRDRDGTAFYRLR